MDGCTSTYRESAPINEYRRNLCGPWYRKTTTCIQRTYHLARLNQCGIMTANIFNATYLDKFICIH
jgi:hypothetical protein